MASSTLTYMPQFDLAPGVALAAGSDLNDLHGHPGTYYVQTDAIAAQISHMPRNASGTLVQLNRGAGTSYEEQFYFPTTGVPFIYVRNFNSSTWSTWIRMGTYEVLEWTPKVYDYNTYIKDLPKQMYIKMCNFYILLLGVYLPDITGGLGTISTMLQFRNVPCTYIQGGQIYVPAGLSGQGGDRTIQPTSNGAIYIRPNITGSSFTEGTFGGWFFGYDI